MGTTEETSTVVFNLQLLYAETYDPEPRAAMLEPKLQDPDQHPFNAGRTLSKLQSELLPQTPHARGP